MKNWNKKILCLLLALFYFSGLAIAQTISIEPRSLDKNGFVPTAPNSYSTSLEHKPRPLIYIQENNKGELVIGGQDDNEIGGMSNTCQTAYDKLYETIFYSYLDYSGDEDWYRGYRNGQNNLNIVLVPPNNKDYAFDIYTACGQYYGTCNYYGKGGIEFCYATLSNYFYVRVYSPINDWSSIAPYYVNAHKNGTCNFWMWGGKPSKNPLDCKDALVIPDTKLQNQNNDVLETWFFQDLWKPSGNYQDRIEPYGASIGAQNTVAFSATINAPFNGWPENGTYPDRSFFLAYCSNTGVLATGKIFANPNPTVNCVQCQNECSYSGQKRCNGSYSQTCGNWDVDPCLEWNNPGEYCQYSCDPANGQCKNCQNECNLGEKRCNGNYEQTCINQSGCYKWDSGKDCGQTQYGNWYCCDSRNYCRDITERGCRNNACYSEQKQEKKSCLGGCYNNVCKECESHHHQGCYDNDIYWFDSCNNPEEKAFDCRIKCVEDQGSAYCINGIKGNFLVTVKNEQGFLEPNAVVSFKREKENEFVFAGRTNNEGKFSFSDIWPYHDNYQPLYEINAVSQGGKDCGIRTTRIDRENDTDAVMLKCPLGKSNQFLHVFPDRLPESILLGQPLQQVAIVKDQLFSPVNQALAGMIRPYNKTPLSGHSNEQGQVSFIDPSPPAGSHNFQFVASRPDYRQGEAWKKITVKPQTVRIQVFDKQYQPVFNAKILVDNQIVGYTNAQGILDAVVQKSPTTFEARNTDDIHCGYRTAKAGEQITLVCPYRPLLRVDVDTNQGNALANVVVAVDEQLLDWTNVFGFAVTRIPSGSHTVDIYYRLDVNAPLFTQRQQVNIDGNRTAILFIADDQHGTRVKGFSQSDRNESIRPQIFGIDDALILGGLALFSLGAAVTIESIGQSSDSLCECQLRNSPELNMTYQTCQEVFAPCHSHPPNSEQCIENTRLLNLATTQCGGQYSGLGFNMIMGWFVADEKAGLSIIGKVGGKLKAIPLPDLAQLPFIQELKNIGIMTWETTGGRAYNYVIEQIENTQNLLVRIKLFNGRILTLAVSRVVDAGVDLKIIPNFPHYADKLSEYAEISLRNGVDPLADSVNQLNQMYYKQRLRTAMWGDEIVENITVLKKGDMVSYGSNHIFIYIRPGQTTTRAQQMIEAFPLSFRNTDDVLNGIRETVERGEIFQYGPFKIRKPFPAVKNPQGVVQYRYFEVWVNEDTFKGVSTIIPGAEIP